jgi:DNA oxidative demethylase
LAGSEPDHAANADRAVDEKDMNDLPGLGRSDGSIPILGKEATLLAGFARRDAGSLMAALEQVLAKAPFRRMTTPGGYLMSVTMTNCGRAGWLTDRRGYRYDSIDPVTGDPWPPMPTAFRQIATRAAAVAGYESFAPDAA